MGNQKQKWTAEEEEALLAGIAKHGPGKWKNILKDPEFAPSLSNRSNIDLKDKWRNLSVSTSGHSSKDRLRLAKVKSITATHYPTTNSAPTIAQACNASSDTAMDDSSNSLQDGKNASQYNTLIFEALSTTKDANGCDIGAIFGYIEQRLDVPKKFRRLLSARLRRLVAQGKLEKDQKYYKISQHCKLGIKAPAAKPKDNHLLQLPQIGVTTRDATLDEAAMTAAYKVSEAENKSFLAAEAVKEAERVSKMAEETDAMLQLVKGIY